MGKSNYIERMRQYQKGGVIQPKGDPYEYKREGDKFLTRKKGSNKWILSSGSAEKAIKEKIFKVKDTPITDLGLGKAQDPRLSENVNPSDNANVQMQSLLPPAGYKKASKLPSPEDINFRDQGQMSSAEGNFEEPQMDFDPTSLDPRLKENYNPTSTTSVAPDVDDTRKPEEVVNLPSKDASFEETLKSTYKNMVGKPLQAAQNAVPLNVRQFGSDLVGDRRELNETHLSKGEKEALTQARITAQKQGKNFIEYSDYGTHLDKDGKPYQSPYADVGGGAGFDLVKKFFNPKYATKTTFGQIGFKKNPDNTYTYSDQFNYNDSKLKNSQSFLEGAKQKGFSLYGQLRNVGRHFGSGPGEGSKVDITFQKGGLRRYQPGGMRMYGDPKLGDQTFANIVYQESEAGKEEALKKQMEEAQADNTAMEEANAALQRQYSIGNRIEASGQTALQAGAKGLLKAADPLKGQTPNWTNAMIPNAAGETASLASGTAAAAATDATTDAATGALADATTNAATKGAGKLATFASKYVNPAHAKAVSPYAIAGQIAGQGIKYLSDDDDATTMNFGEGAGGVISGAASGAGFGSIFGPVGTAVGGVVGGLYGLGKGIYQRNKARNTIGAAEDEKAEELNRIGAQMRAEGVKSREYSGYDFGRTLAKHGGPRMYQTAGFDMSMLANNNLPSGYTAYQDTEPHTAVAAPEDTFMNRVHKFAQNPVTQIQKAANMTPGGVAGRNTMDYAVDLINLPGAVSKVVQGASKGDPSKLAAGIVQSVPYAKPITKGLGVLENAGANVTNAYKTFANNTLRLGKDNSKYAMKGIVKNASPDFINQGVTDSTLVDPRTISQESTRVDMPMYRFKAGGVKLPGGTMNPIPGSDAVEFKGRPHSKGGILLDEQTEVEGGETMDKVTMKNEGPSDYFFSKYLKLGGRSYAQRHKDILKKGGTQQDIDALAMSQEKTAGRNPGIIQMERGGAYQYQFGGYGITNNDYSNPPLRDLSGLSSSQLNAEIQKVGADPRLNQYAKDKQLTALYAQLNSSKKGTPVPSVMGLLQKEPSGYFRSTPGNFGKLGEYENAPAVQTPTPTNTSTSTAAKATVAPLPTAGPVDEDQVMFDNEQEAMAGLQPLPTINTSPAAKGKSSNDDLIMEDVNAQIADLEAKRDSVGLTKDEQKALNNLYRDVPLGAYAAGAAQMLPAAYAFLRKEKAQKLMGPAGRIGSPKLDRVDFNKERSQNASDARALNKSIETSGSGPAGIIAKMAAFNQKQKGDMQIAASESRANAGIQAQEAQMKQQADLTNVQNALAVDNVNTAMMENQRVADENRRYMAIDKLANTSAGLMGDVMSYKANERMARAIGSMGIYEREKLFNSMLGKVNPRTGRPYTKDDIAELYNISLEDNNLLQEAQTSKDMENMSVYERAMAVAAGRKANGKQGR